MKFIALILFTAPLLGAVPGRESVAMQEFRLEMAEHGQALHSHKVELELLHEKMENLQYALSQFKDEIKGSGEVDLEVTKERARELEKKVTALEKNTKTLSSDLSLLKDHINATASSIGQIEQKVAVIEKDLNSDIKTLKSTMQSLVAYVEGGSSSKISTKNYIVQSGDTLEKIAQKNKTSIRELKELNDIQGDKIFSGQKLQIP